MTAAIPIPPRVLALLGALLLAAAAFLVLRPVLLSEEESTSVSPPTPITAPTTPATPATPAPATPAVPVKPRIQLVSGLPASVAGKLRQSRVVVVAVYSGTSSSDRAAVGEARRGARTVGANFAKLNVLNEQQAREVRVFASDVSVPAILVVRRPGKIVTRLEGMQDSSLVAQAAYNAGARGR